MEETTTTDEQNTVDAPAARRAKVLALIKTGDNVSMSVNNHEFSAMSAAQRNEVINNLLRNYADHFTSHAEQLEEDALVPINPGALYDDVEFDVAFYADAEQNMEANVSFGRQIMPDAPVRAALTHVAAVLRDVASQHEKDTTGQGSQAPQGTVPVRGSGRF